MFTRGKQGSLCPKFAQRYDTDERVGSSGKRTEARGEDTAMDIQQLSVTSITCII